MGRSAAPEVPWKGPATARDHRPPAPPVPSGATPCDPRSRPGAANPTPFARMEHAMNQNDHDTDRDLRSALQKSLDRRG
ncbi:hypothetical protein [Actinomadura rayongensis]|uniref:hypothetical protein n=1 Tax=Actinomadura rayongensis TaxID=1429076 RepID=UPI0035E5BA02